MLVQFNDGILYTRYDVSRGSSYELRLVYTSSRLHLVIIVLSHAFNTIVTIDSSCYIEFSCVIRIRSVAYVIAGINLVLFKPLVAC